MFHKSAVLCAVLTLLVTVTPYIALADSTSTPQATSTAASSTPTIDPYNTTDVEAAVRAYFADIPVMAEIAKCESGFTQYNTNGKVLNGGSGGMLGVFQINGAVHKTFALTLGDDIKTLAGNMAYARYLYNNEGTDPWISSEGCWGKVVSAGLVPKAASSTLGIIKEVVTPTVAKASTLPAVSAKSNSSATLSINLKVGAVSQQVATLQQLLNSAGYKVAKNGAGSPGQETTLFGSATKAAVERFQCTHNIACTGTEATTGYGFVGAKTRAALNNEVAMAQ